jgi:hypothetical protein
LFFAVIITSCATTYKDFKMKHVEEGEGVAIGIVKVKYNGQEFTKNCSVCLNSVNGPCQGLTDEGYVFMNLKQGERSVRRIVCKDSSLQHYNIDGATFIQSPGITYFGQVDISWNNKGGFKASDMFGLVGAAISESRNDGQIQMSVSTGKLSEVIQVFKDQTKQESVKVSKSIAKVGK